MRWVLTAALCLVSACGSDDKTTPAPLTVTANVGSGQVPSVPNGVKANGNNLVTIEVSGATKSPIRLTTGRGTFPGGERSVTIEGTSASVNLIACDARTDNACAGAATVSASDGNFAFGQTTVTLVGYETVCNNLRDDNRDLRTDCADPDCNDQACVDVSANTGVCQSSACLAAVCSPSSDEICDNGVDDDCDRSIDCEQPGCEGRACKAGAPTFACNNRMCTDAVSGLGVAVTAKRSRIPADGVATTTVSAKITKATVPQSGVQVDFTTDVGTIVGAATVTTSADGTATVTLQSSAAAGTATVTAALHNLPAVSQKAFVEMPALGSIVVSSIQSAVMGVKFSGFNEQNQISVLILDTEQKPYPDGLAVRFEHQQLGGSTISTPLTADTATCMQTRGCLGFEGRTASAPGKADMQGLATVTLTSGTAAGPISAAVSATAGGVTRTFNVQNMAIVGAKASGLHVSLLCTPKNVPGFVKNDCTNSFYDGAGDTTACTVFLADRFNNVLGVSTRADFRSEAGSAGPPVVTAPYDPGKGGDQTADLGHATDSVSVTGYRLPADVGPVTGEFTRSFSSGGCGMRQHNPRDGLSAVIVAVPGEEGFVDINGNGVYEQGEPFIDTGEPFVDEDDNGLRESDEPFIDVNQSGAWDGPNGTWDANTVIWAETRVAYTGQLGPDARWLALDKVSTLPAVTDAVTYDLVSGTPPGMQTFAVYLADENFNPMSTRAVYAIGVSSGDVGALFSVAASTTDTIGVTLTQLFCDKAPPAVAGACNSTCKSSPCFRVTKLSGFSYGRVANVNLVAGPSKGSGSVRVVSTIGDDQASVSIGGVVH